MGLSIRARWRRGSAGLVVTRCWCSVCGRRGAGAAGRSRAPVSSSSVGGLPRHCSLGGVRRAAALALVSARAVGRAVQAPVLCPVSLVAAAAEVWGFLIARCPWWWGCGAPALSCGLWPRGLLVCRSGTGALVRAWAPQASSFQRLALKGLFFLVLQLAAALLHLKTSCGVGTSSRLLSRKQVINFSAEFF